MVKYLQIPVGEHGSINVEIEPAQDSGGFTELGIQNMAETAMAEATEAFDKLTATIHAVAYGFREHIDRLEKHVRPDEVSVEFGLTFKADAGVVVAKAGAEASFKIGLTWKSSPSQQGK